MSYELHARDEQEKKTSFFDNPLWPHGPNDAICYLIVIPQRPLNPRMMFKADPAIKAPWVARMPLRNLCNFKQQNLAQDHTLDVEYKSLQFKVQDMREIELYRGKKKRVPYLMGIRVINNPFSVNY